MVRNIRSIVIKRFLISDPDLQGDAHQGDHLQDDGPGTAGQETEMIETEDGRHHVADQVLAEGHPLQDAVDTPHHADSGHRHCVDEEKMVETEESLHHLQRNLLG